MESLAQLEALCERLYNSQDSAERAHAESTLKCFSVNTEYISQCQYILDNALTPYALMLASSSLLKQVTEHSLSLQLRLDIRNYLINYLATRGPDLQPFVTGSLIQLFCRVTKFGWFDDDRFREVVKESMNFLSQGTSDHYAIGLKILNQLVSEMNQPNPGLPSTHHRKVACSFRDQSLFQIFQISLTSLCQLKNDVASRLQELALSLSLKCLSFDFVGTSLDESSDEFGTVQIPSSWRPVLEDSSTLQIFFDYYAITKPHLSKEALECLVRLASVRRSLFTNDTARSKFLAHLMTGTKEILQTEQGLADHDNYHEYCRLLGRFRVNYQLSELVNVEGYSDWIRLVAEFTSKSLQSWQWASSSVYYLLGLWSRLVTSVPYLKGDTPSLLDEFVPKITEGFITSRFDSVQAGFPDDLSENPLDNVELLQDQLDCFPHLCRFQYERSSLYIIKIVEPILQTYTESARLQTSANNSKLSVIEAKLSWIVHIISAILKIRQSTSCSAESQEIIDAELSARVLQLVNVTDSGLHTQLRLEVSRRDQTYRSPEGIGLSVGERGEQEDPLAVVVLRVGAGLSFARWQRIWRNRLHQRAKWRARRRRSARLSQAAVGEEGFPISTVVGDGGRELARVGASCNLDSFIVLGLCGGGLEGLAPFNSKGGSSLYSGFSSSERVEFRNSALGSASLGQGEESAMRSESGSAKSSTLHRLEDSIWFQCSVGGSSASSTSTQSVRSFRGRHSGERSLLKESLCGRASKLPVMPKLLVQVCPKLFSIPSPKIQFPVGKVVGSGALEGLGSSGEREMGFGSPSKVGEVKWNSSFSSSVGVGVLSRTPEGLARFGVFGLGGLGVGDSPSRSGGSPVVDSKGGEEYSSKEEPSVESNLGLDCGGQKLVEPDVVDSGVFAGFIMEETAGSEVLASIAEVDRFDVSFEVVGSLGIGASSSPRLDVATENAKIDLFEDDDEFEEFEIEEDWDDKEEAKEITQQWEDDWDDDDVSDDFSLQLRRELENNNEKS
ncbi:hypothetical protein HHK36_017091 [Tetracentron sinense]|uniref:26S proteasome complex subunit SEM1 n=1 Tax=Tetracentron sinense TaxID=13715 RepID=A0A834Z0Q3_TETSI|nr:hypothetical protein HHK36_017091 [Tetracentron sinense]